MHKLLTILATCLLSFPALADKTQVILKTDLGTVELEVDAEKAPATVENFLAYVDSGFYNGLIFHRVIPGFMAQGGGFTFDFQKKETLAPVANESDNGLSNLRGTISMARTNDPHSATSQFFINLVDNTRLDGSGEKPGYTVFGKVVKGMEVVDKIAVEPRGMYLTFPNAPNTPVRVLEAKRLHAKNAKAAVAQKTDATKKREAGQ